MKLYYYKDHKGNFGDELNPWLWGKLLPEELDDDDSSRFVGIGTLLNHKLPKCQKKVIFGTGVGYGGVPEVDETWKIYCVRGEYSSNQLGIAKSYAVSDGALLVRLLGVNRVKKKYKFSFMPHHTSALNANWEMVCEQAGIHYISPFTKDGVSKVLAEIQSTEIMLAEAMHGAIVADALRVPWIPVKAYDHINDYKWKDWADTIGVPYKPNTLSSIWDLERDMIVKDLWKNKLKKHLKKMSIWNDRWMSPVPAKSTEFEIAEVIKKMEMLKQEKVFLSSEKKINYLTETLWTRLQVFKQDVKEGFFADQGQS